MTGLPEKNREKWLLILHWWSAMPADEIGEVLGINNSVADRFLHEARLTVSREQTRRDRVYSVNGRAKTLPKFIPMVAKVGNENDA